MNTVYIGKNPYQVPGHWNELTTRQLKKVIQIMSSGLDIRSQMVKLLFVLLSHVGSFRLAWILYVKVSDEGKYDMLRLTEFLYKDLTLTKHKLSHVYSRTGFLSWEKLNCPADSILPSLTFMEFIQCEVAFYFYLNGENDEEKKSALDLLAGILCQKDRSSFDSENLEHYRKKGSGISSINKQLLSIWYEGCRNEWTTLFPEVFPGQEKSGQMESKEKQSREIQSPGPVWLQALRSMSGGAIYIDEMSRVKAPAALYELNNKIIENREREEELERLKSQ